MATTHIIGAGLAGLTAAVTLARAGHFVQLYEASGAAGGRVRLLYDADDNRGYDGCNAVIFGAHTHLLELATSLGSAHSFESMGMAGESYDLARKQRQTRKAFLLPPHAPLLDICTLLSLSCTRSHAPVSRYVDYYHPLSESYIEPLCKTLMHQSTDAASASVLGARIRRYASKGRKGMRLLIPKHSLYHSLIAPALSQIEQEGGAVYFSQTLRGLEWNGNTVCGLNFTKQKKNVQLHDTVILALPAPTLLQLKLPIAPVSTTASDVVSVVYRTQQDTPARLFPANSGTIDWIKQQHGRTFAITYAAERLLHLDNEGIARTQWRQIAPILGYDAKQMPEARVLRDRKAIATHTHTRSQHIANNLYCAGETFAPSALLPLEAAIASGKAAAALILSR